MTTKLTYIIEFVADLDLAVRFYQDVIPLPLKFQSSGWAPNFLKNLLARLVEQSA